MPKRNKIAIQAQSSQPLSLIDAIESSRQWCRGAKRQKKVLLLFDYACHPCTGTMLIFSVLLSVCLMPLPEGRAIISGDIKMYKVCKKGKEKIRFKFEMKDDLNTFILDSRRSTSASMVAHFR